MWWEGGNGGEDESGGGRQAMRRAGPKMRRGLGRGPALGAVDGGKAWWCWEVGQAVETRGDHPACGTQR